MPSGKKKQEPTVPHIFDYIAHDGEMEGILLYVKFSHRIGPASENRLFIVASPFITSPLQSANFPRYYTCDMERFGKDGLQEGDKIFVSKSGAIAFLIPADAKMQNA